MVGFVYFIRCPSNGLIKIGWTSSCPDIRFIGIQSGCPVELEKVGVLAGALQRERTLHSHFGHLRVRGEWFTPGPDLMAFIEEKAKPWPTSRFGMDTKRMNPAYWQAKAAEDREEEKRVREALVRLRSQRGIESPEWMPDAILDSFDPRC